VLVVFVARGWGSVLEFWEAVVDGFDMLGFAILYIGGGYRNDRVETRVLTLYNWQSLASKYLK
jgi:hypothetical protein